MQFLYCALSSNELKALYILLPLAHLYTPRPSQLLNRAYNPDTRCKAPQVINASNVLHVLRHRSGVGQLHDIWKILTHWECLSKRKSLLFRQ